MAALAFALGFLLAFPPQEDGLEKRAVASLKQVSVSTLDPNLPKLSFLAWFNRTVGGGAGIQWQVTDCGEQTGTTVDRDRDIPLCVEVIAVMPDERKAVIDVQVGTFKRGVAGTPQLYFAIIEHEGELYSAKQLGDLPQMLRAPLPKPVTKPRRKPVLLPALTKSGSAPRFRPYVGPIAEGAIASPPQVGDIAPPPPGTNRSADLFMGEAVVRVTPSYPEGARRLGVKGEVQVEVTVGEDGRVIQAVALSGHELLKGAAETAARKWVFKPATLNGKPGKVKGTLTFVFTRP
jgi:TonB family protein